MSPASLLSRVGSALIFPTSSGWALDMVEQRRDGSKIVHGYGYAPSRYEIDTFLHWHFVGSRDADVRMDLRPVHFGRRYEPILPHPRGSLMGSDPSRFLILALGDYLYDAETTLKIYDTVTDIEFTIDRRDGTPVIAAASGLDYWPDTTPDFDPVMILGGKVNWPQVARDAAGFFLKRGSDYNPVILSGLPRQPRTREELLA